MSTLVQVTETVPKNESLALTLWKKWWPYLLAALLCFLAKLPTLNNYILFIDEPTYLIYARRLSSPETFFYSFSYLTEPKFPLGMLPDLLALALSPANAIFIKRLCGLVAVICSACLLLGISKRMFTTFLPGFLSLAFWLVLLNSNIPNAAPLLEYYQTPLLLLSFLFFISRNEHKTFLFWSGFCLGLATLVKATAIIVAPIFCLALILGSYSLTRWETAEFVKQKIVEIFILGLGIALPLGLFILPYLLRPETLIDLKFNLLDVSSSYGGIGNKTILNRLFEQLPFLSLINLVLIAGTMLVFAYSLLKKVKSGQSWSKTDVSQLLLLATGWFVFLGYSTGQPKLHYTIPVLPFLMLFVGYRVRLIWQSFRNPRHRFLFTLVLTLFIAIGQIGSLIFYSWVGIQEQNYYDSQLEIQNQSALVNYISANSQIQDSIWVYYNMPELYWQANRRPATNDPVGSWLVHINTPFWYQKTLQELEKERPALVIGIEKPRFVETQVPGLTQLPLIKNWLAQNYSCEDSLIAGATVCKRKV